MPPVTERPKSWNRFTDPASAVPTRWRRADVSASLAEELNRLVDDDEPLQTIDHESGPWDTAAGWALRLLAREPAELPSRDVADWLEWVGSGDELEWFESPDLEGLEGSLRPHEHGRHPADVYGLQEQIDRARTRAGVQQRSKRQNRANARLLARH